MVAHMEVLLLPVALVLGIVLLEINAVKTNCDVACPEPTEISCPSDSFQKLFHPNSSSTINDDDTHYHSNDDKTVQKRAVSYTRRESIKIVPGDYIHRKKRRSLLISTCCPYFKCVCKEDCKFSCPSNMNAVQINTSPSISGKPGNCCPTYECMKPRYCISERSQKYYDNGSQWQDDECTTCQCLNGEVKCFTMFCKAPSCMKPKIVPGECCPVCDHSETNFCPGFENCDRICKYGFQHTDEGCDNCTCSGERKHKITTTTSTTTPSPETSVNEIKDNSSLINDNDNNSSKNNNNNNNNNSNNNNNNNNNNIDNVADIFQIDDDVLIDKHENPNISAIIVVVVVLVAAILTTIFFCLRCKKKKSYNTVAQ